MSYSLSFGCVSLMAFCSVARIVSRVFVVVALDFILVCLITTGTVDAEITLKADKIRAEVNVGNRVSLVWKYDTDQQNYEAVIWGKGDSNGINFQTVYFTKTPQQRSPVLYKTVPADIGARVKITNRATLVISNAKYSDRGYYICEVRSDFVTLKKKIYLEVYGK